MNSSLNASIPFKCEYCHWYPCVKAWCMCVSKRVSVGCVCHLSKISSVNATYKIFKYSFLFLLWSCSRLLVSKRKQKKWTKWCSNWWEACSHSNGNKFRFGYIVCMAQVITNTMQQLNVKASIWNCALREGVSSRKSRLWWWCVTLGNPPMKPPTETGLIESYNWPQRFSCSNP